MLAACIGAPDIIPFRTGELLLYGIRVPLAAFVREGGKGRSETVAGHLARYKAEPANRDV